MTLLDHYDKIIPFLKELKSSYHKNEIIYTEGSCFRLFCMLKILYPSANPYYSNTEGHWITEIKNKFYDINGEICPNFVYDRNYKLISDKKILSSAYIPTYKRQCTRYNKYL